VPGLLAPLLAATAPSVFVVVGKFNLREASDSELGGKNDQVEMLGRVKSDYNI